MSTLRQATIRLAHTAPVLRKHLVPLLRKYADQGDARVWSGDKAKAKLPGALPGETELALAYIDNWSRATIKHWAPAIQALLQTPLPPKLDLYSWFEYTSAIRKLRWESDQWFKPVQLVGIMQGVVPSYNAFSAKRVIAVIARYAPDALVSPQRKNSVAMVVKAPPEQLIALSHAQRSLRADEAKLTPGQLYLWWD